LVGWNDFLGWHPWFTHLISLDEFSNVKSKRDHYAALFSPASSQEEQEFSALLSTFPDPTPLSSILSSLRSNLLAFPNAMLGEVGLDRAFRIPLQPYGSEGPGAKKQLSLFGVPLEHQLAILEAQIGIAVELGRNVSLHSVKSPSITVDLLKRMRERYQTRWERISVDLHSCGLSPEIWNGIEVGIPFCAGTLTE
jgi:Tat protein secretion system quality control protein TatD with DNase activity